MSDTSSPILLRQEGEILIATIASPPVNALGQNVRAGLRDALVKLENETDVAAMIIAGSGRMFSAGADITEFNKPRLSPSLAELNALIEGSDKPVVAVLHGRALGGGLEMALACDARIAAPDTGLALPEVLLGLVPGAGGTQRLPRIIGPEAALNMIASGRTVMADEALKLGLVDVVPEGDAIAAAIDFIHQAQSEGKKVNPQALRNGSMEVTCQDRTSFEAAAAKILRRARGQMAPAFCVQAVRMALELPIEEGLAEERKMFATLEHGPQSKALRHVFFAERDAARLPDGVRSQDVPEMTSAAVLGAGTMGGGIAWCFANAGIPVVLIDTTEEGVNRGRKAIESLFDRAVRSGKLSADEAANRLALVSIATTFEAAAGADVVVEAVYEDLNLKKDVFLHLDELLEPGALLASNTSTLNIDAIAAVTRRPERIIGMHFFSPANAMRLVEIVRTRRAAPKNIARAIQLAKRLNKVCAVVGVCDGFVGNRMIGKRSIQCDRLLLEGATPVDIDNVVKDFGFPMGPLAVADLAGLDIAKRVRETRGLIFPVADALYEAGRYGQKTSAGYYRYEKGSHTPQPDPAVIELIHQASARTGHVRRTIPPEEILDRMLLPVINEGARILAEGFATRPGDIDVILVHGYGWPAWRGGPMYYADERGLADICERLRALAVKTADEDLMPTPLLTRMVAEGRRFSDLKNAVSR